MINSIPFSTLVYTNTVTGENCQSYKITPIERNVSARPNTGKKIELVLSEAFLWCTAGQDAPLWLNLIKKHFDTKVTRDPSYFSSL